MHACTYCTLLGKCTWTGPDKPDMAFAIKKLARKFAKPTMLAMKLFRYVQGTRRAYHDLIGELGTNDEVTAYADADWALTSCDKIFTNGGFVLVEVAQVQLWSRSQPGSARSTCEAELHSMGMAAKEAKLFEVSRLEITAKDNHAIVPYTGASSAR